MSTPYDPTVQSKFTVDLATNYSILQSTPLRLDKACARGCCRREFSKYVQLHPALKSVNILIRFDKTFKHPLTWSTSLRKPLYLVAEIEFLRDGRSCSKGRLYMPYYEDGRAIEVKIERTPRWELQGEDEEVEVEEKEDQDDGEWIEYYDPAFRRYFYSCRSAYGVICEECVWNNRNWAMGDRTFEDVRVVEHIEDIAAAYAPVNEDFDINPFFDHQFAANDIPLVYYPGGRPDPEFEYGNGYNENGENDSDDDGALLEPLAAPPPPQDDIVVRFYHTEDPYDYHDNDQLLDTFTLHVTHPSDYHEILGRIIEDPQARATFVATELEKERLIESAVNRGLLRPHWEEEDEEDEWGSVDTDLDAGVDEEGFRAQSRFLLDMVDSDE